MLNGARFRLVMMPQRRTRHTPSGAVGSSPAMEETDHAVPHLGRTGMQVSSLVLGAMNFGSIGRTTQDEATAIVDAALEGGVTPPALLDPAPRRR